VSVPPREIEHRRPRTPHARRSAPLRHTRRRPRTFDLAPWGNSRVLNRETDSKRELKCPSRRRAASALERRLRCSASILTPVHALLIAHRAIRGASRALVAPKNDSRRGFRRIRLRRVRLARCPRDPNEGARRRERVARRGSWGGKSGECVEKDFLRDIRPVNGRRRRSTPPGSSVIRSNAFYLRLEARFVERRLT